MFIVNDLMSGKPQSSTRHAKIPMAGPVGEMVAKVSTNYGCCRSYKLPVYT
jgi:hypothetical protein